MTVRLDPRVNALGALRFGPRQDVLYAPVGFIAPTQVERHRAVERVVRMALGGVQEFSDDSYAILDGYDDAGDLIVDYGIRDARAFRFLYRQLGWRGDRP